MQDRLDNVLFQDPVNRACGLNAGLVSWWLNLPNRFGGGGLRFRDLCRRNHGTLTNGPTWVGGGRPGGWGALSTANASDRVNVPEFFAGFNKVVNTVSLWFYARGLANAPVLFSSGNSEVHFFGEVDATHIYWNTGGGNSFRTYSVSLSAGRWYHLAFCRTGAGDSGTLYLDGNTLSSYAGSMDGSGTVSGTDLWVGNYFSAGLGLDGLTDDFRAYSGRGLSASEVLALYQDSRRGHPDTLRRPSRRAWFVPAAAPGGFQAAWAVGSNVVLTPGVY